jgi:hypothetical protein
MGIKSSVPLIADALFAPVALDPLNPPGRAHIAAVYEPAGTDTVIFGSPGHTRAFETCCVEKPVRC